MKVYIKLNNDPTIPETFCFEPHVATMVVVLEETSWKHQTHLDSSCAVTDRLFHTSSHAK